MRSIKATRRRKRPGLPALADDSGLEVDALDGAPGIYSARWAGPDEGFRASPCGVSRTKLRARKRLDAAPAPRANFIARALPGLAGRARWRVFEGKVDGHLVWPPRGTRGFGYDPMFVPDGDELTFGEMEPDAKHRDLAPRPRFRRSSPRLPRRRRAGLSRASASTSTGRSAPRSAPIATSTAMSARRHRRSPLRSPRYLRELDTGPRGAGPQPSRSIFFGGGTPSLMPPGDGRRDPRGDRAAGGRSPPMPRSRWRPIPRASRPSAFAAIAPPGSTASRSACRRSTTPICAPSAACTRPRRRSRPSDSPRHLPALLVRSDLCPPGPDARGLAARAGEALALPAEHLSLYQLTIEAGHALRRPARARQAARARAEAAPPTSTKRPRR